MHAPASTRFPGAQRGAALVVALLFLVALTLLGLAALGGNTLQQRMAYSLSETNRAFQAAESALVGGETWLEAQTARPVPDCGMAGEGCPLAVAIWPAVIPGPVNETPPPATGPRGMSSNAIDVPADKRKPNYAFTDWWLDHGRLFGFDYVDGQTPAQQSGQDYRIGGREYDTDNARYPRYVIEELGKDPSSSLVQQAGKYTIWYYQVTARGAGILERDFGTVVQSVYVRGF